MNTAHFPPYASNSAFVACWPHPRPRSQSRLDHNPRHPELCAALCPTRGAIPADVLPMLRFADIAHLCRTK